MHEEVKVEVIVCIIEIAGRISAEPIGSVLGNTTVGGLSIGNHKTSVIGDQGIFAGGFVSDIPFDTLVTSDVGAAVVS